MKSQNVRWLWLTLTTAATVFIFYNAAQTASNSNATSDSVIEWFRPLLDAIDSIIGTVDWDFWVRKAAHVTEYALLGVTTVSFANCIAERCGRPLVAHAALYVLIVAVTDEFIQSFVERTSAVYDILIDFGGGLLGFGLVALIGALRSRRNHKKQH